ncbi:hypothetical protein NTG1052_700008 [Candidatus Nitrotoga sp. 1052]|nr:hypothetical protein NTG1052_700008 [Candidatus Nitrotoga sp. 1052]
MCFDHILLLSIDTLLLSIYLVRIIHKDGKQHCIGLFPADEALLKLVCLVLQNISGKWATLIRDWKAALDRFTIQLRSGCQH